MSRRSAATSAGPWPDDGRWHYRRSLASRVGVLSALAVGAAVTSMALAVFLLTRVQLQASVDESLLDRASKAAEYTTLSQITAQEVPPWMLGAADVRVIFITSDRGMFSADAVPDFQLGAPELRVAKGKSDESIRTVTDGNGTQWRVATVPAGTGQALVLAQPMTSQHVVLSKLGTVLGLYGLIGVGAAALAGWAVAANGLRPVRRLTKAVEEIAVTEDLAPLRVEGHDEIARLAGAFNLMLLSLSASRDLQRRLIADASHELRTPLTSLRTNLDLLRQSDAGADNGGPTLDTEARSELLDDVRAQIEELSTLVDDLVMLARDHQPSEVIAEVDLARVTERALARVRRRAPLAEFDVALSPWKVNGDANGLERAVTNLLDNAAKWSPPGSTITVRLADGLLTIDDEGPGIPEKDRPHVFDRFYRADESRAMPGSGLGLAIVHQVVDRHGGEVSVHDAPGGGARMVLQLPGAGQTAPAAS
ncbi:MAG: ATP-binding protein [Nocardioides sp.]|uniref:sensor histidine kinase n=1 Tax=Nocardioides sp. TaxID=35761 RepID=UPI003F0E1605